jgi:Uma2 family endonuclease
MKARHMTPVSRRTDKSSGTALPLLCNGDRLTQAEFHRRYLTYPDDVHFELIGGIVYLPSPKRVPHSNYDGELGFIYGLYRRGTPGVEELHGATTILGEESEPEPDLGLRILEEYGGRSYVDDKGYLNGSPELLSEIAHSTVAIDMHLKKTDYETKGVGEYLVLCVAEQQLHWFDFANRGLILPDAKGIYRSRIFPGLWIDGPALLARQSDRVLRVAKQGLASPEHAAFVKRLQAVKRKRKSK